MLLLLVFGLLVLLALLALLSMLDPIVFITHLVNVTCAICSLACMVSAYQLAETAFAQYWSCFDEFSVVLVLLFCLWLQPGLFLDVTAEIIQHLGDNALLLAPFVYIVCIFVGVLYN